MSQLTTTTVFEISDAYLAESASYDHLNETLVVALENDLRFYTNKTFNEAVAFMSANDLDAALANLGSEFVVESKDYAAGADTSAE